jgi:hypothetical protein
MSNTFHIYDKKLKNKLEMLYISWKKVLDYERLFHSSTNGNYHILQTPNSQNGVTVEEINELTKISQKLHHIFKDLIIFIREYYLEVDLDALSRKAGQVYLEDGKQESNLLK